MLASTLAAVAGGSLADAQTAGSTSAPSGISTTQAPQAGATASPVEVTASRGTQNRTLVCIYLLGGSDGNSMIAPLEPSQYKAYAAARGALALMTEALLPINDGGTGARYGLDPRLSELQKYFQAGSAAVIANMGGPVRPTAASRYESLRFLRDAYVIPEWAARAAGSRTGDDAAFTFRQGVTLVPLGNSTFQGERRKNPELIEKIDACSFRTSFPDTMAGKMMRTVAGLLKTCDVAGSNAGQVAFCTMNGFGPSPAQTISQSPLLHELSSAMAALYEATVEMGIADGVTIYTDSEYGRTLRPNDRHTAGPGWGNHHFVLGGAVRGGRIYGTFPDMIHGPFDTDSAMIPTTSQAQYQAALAAWAGVSANNLATVVPGFDGKPAPGFLPA